MCCGCFFLKQKTAYELRISDWSSDVCSSDLMRVVSGQVDHFGAELQMTHPDHIGRVEELDRLKTVEPLYPLTAGLTGRIVAKAAQAALAKAPEPPEWLAPAYQRARAWPSLRTPLMAAHRPEAGRATGGARGGT